MLPLLEDKAEKGNAKAQYALGWVYFVGLGTEKNDEKALLWMTKAAGQDLVAAQETIGSMYLLAKDLPNNYAIAKAWLQKSAEKNNPDAWNGLGGIYSQGLGERSEEHTSELQSPAMISYAADRADSNLGFIYYEGKLVPKDLKEAARYMRLAADKNNVRATYNLGVMYRDGLGVAQDSDKAFQLFLKAANEFRYPAAGYAMGVAYYTGQGVQRDLIRAYMWTKLAVDQGFKPRTNLMDTLASKMTPEQIEEGQRQVAEWIRDHKNKVPSEPASSTQ